MKSGSKFRNCQTAVPRHGQMSPFEAHLTPKLPSDWANVRVPAAIQMPLEQINLHRSTTAQSFCSTATFRRIPLNSAEKNEAFRARRNIRSVPLCGERYCVIPAQNIFGCDTETPSSPTRGDNEDVHTCTNYELVSPRHREREGEIIGEAEGQRGRFAEGQKAVERARLLKRTSQLLHHRLNRGYCLTGNKLSSSHLIMPLRPALMGATSYDQANTLHHNHSENSQWHESSPRYDESYDHDVHFHENSATPFFVTQCSPYPYPVTRISSKYVEKKEASNDEPEEHIQSCEKETLSAIEGSREEIFDSVQSGQESTHTETYQRRRDYNPFVGIPEASKRKISRMLERYQSQEFLQLESTSDLSNMNEMEHNQTANIFLDLASDGTQPDVSTPGIEESPVSENHPNKTSLRRLPHKEPVYLASRVVDDDDDVKDEEEESETDDLENIPLGELNSYLKKATSTLQFDRNIFKGTTFPQEHDKVDKRTVFREVAQHLIVTPVENPSHKDASDSPDDEIIFVQPVMTPNQCQIFTTFFDQLDRNKTGKVARKDVKRFLSFQVNKRSLPQFVRAFDINQDGFIDQREFIAAAALNDRICNQITTNMADKWKLDLKNLRHYLIIYREMFEMCDIDHDDKISLEEFMVIISTAISVKVGTNISLMEDIFKTVNRSQTGGIDFIDYLTYLPFFLDIHNHLMDRPNLIELIESARHAVKRTLKEQHPHRD